MLSVRGWTFAGAALPALLAVTPASAQASDPAAASAAYDISAKFTSENMTTSLGPVNDVNGAAPPAYSKTKVLDSYDQSIAVPPLVPSPSPYPMVASFTAQAKHLRSHAASNGIQLDFVSATGDSQIRSANLQIVEPVSSTLEELALGVNASAVADSASYSKVFPNHVSVEGSASFGSLSITGSLVGGHTITYSGSAPPNTVLYQSPTSTPHEMPAVVITANQQQIVYLISCNPNCTATPQSIEVHALDISLNNAPIEHHPVTGDIVLGDSSAR